MSHPHEHNDYDRRASGDPSDAESEHDLSRRVYEQQNRPASIDMALNLERELDAEHAEHDEQHDREQHQREASASSYSASANTGEDSSASVSAPDSSGSRRVSLDPHVLQHIVANLRAELARVTQERDALTETLANAPTREAELREALSLLTEQYTTLEEEIEQLRRKSQDDDESINMLRTKLEESRRALMRLQAESKRMSHMSVDTSRANSLFGGAPSSSKRASFTPLTGSGAGRMYNHRRISSVSEPSFELDTGMEPGSPTNVGRTISWPEEGDANAKKARRSSAFFGGMPVSMGSARSTSPSPPTHQHQLATNADEVDMLRKERDTARAEVMAARQELAEAQEAREASEQCVSALRTFIAAQAENDADGNGILKLPPLPTEKNAEEQQTPNKRARPAMSAGWSFGKLFRTDSGGSGSASDSNAVSPPANGSPAASSGTPSFSTSAMTSNGNGSGGNSPSPSTATPGGAFTRTFGGFFSGRAPSITSLASVASPQDKDKETSKPVHPLTAHGQQEPTLNGLGSDEEGDDSVDEPTEPLSPSSGNRADSELSEIWVHNASSTSAESEGGTGDAASLTLKGKALSEVGQETQEASMPAGAA